MTTHSSRRQAPRHRSSCLLACASLLIPAGAAWAHAFLDSAAPRVGSTVHSPPKEVVLTFTQGVEPAFSKVEVTDLVGTHEEMGAAHIAGTDARKLAVSVGLLTAGTYTVAWHVTSVDTHKTQGQFHFTVAP